MRKLSLRHVNPGMILGKTIYNERGDALLTQGTVLTDRYIGSLARRGFAAVCVHDESTEDIWIEDVISDRARNTATKNIGRMYTLMQQAASPMLQQPFRKIVAGLGSSSFVNKASDNEAFESLHRDVEQIIDETLEAQNVSGMTTLKSHDNYSFCHSVDVAVVALMIGHRLRLDRPMLRQLALGCLLHDIGKIFINTSILNKQGKLTDEEFDQMKQHPTLGFELLRQTHKDELLANHIAYQHHERQDGRGYPRGLRGDNRISNERSGFGQYGRMIMLAEIAAIADVYDALSSDRPYRRGLPTEEVARTLRKLAGSHLNAAILDQFLAILPVYPVGSDVVVTSGKYRNYKGVVAKLYPGVLDRPVVRILTNDLGEPVTPFDLDLRRNADVTIAAHMD